MMTRNIKITPMTITWMLLGIVAFLLLANLLVICLQFIWGFEHVKGFIHGFYFDVEANFPSLYSALAILLSAVLLWYIGKLPNEKKEKRSFYWKFLSFIFIFLAMDEFASLHEDLIQPTQALLGVDLGKPNYLYFAWFIPYSILVLVIGIILFRFFFKLPLRTRMLFVTAGAIFLSGAVVMEMVGGKYWAEQGWTVDGSHEVDLSYALIITVEELLEMVGIIVFIHALSSYYLKDKNDISVFLKISRT